MKNLSNYTASVESSLASIELPSTPSNLYDPIKYIIQLGGKRIRPVLTILAGEMFGIPKEKVMNQAIAIELFHNFSLIHDDIMDEAPKRRGQPTVHEKWNQTIGILSGDALLIKSYQQLQINAGDKTSVLYELFNKTALKVCEGQQMDMDFESRTDVSVAEYIEMIRLKTSVLLGTALEFGAIMANAGSNDRKLIHAFGEHIGIAFQIKDDILDLYGDPIKFGKQIGGDVISNKKTILYLTAASEATLEQREILKQLATSNDPDIKINRTKELYDHLNIPKLCEERMITHYEKALQNLDGINTDKTNKSGLLELAKFLIERDL